MDDNGEEHSDLWGRVGHRPTHVSEFGVRIHSSAQAKVNNLNLSAGTDNKILQLEISMRLQHIKKSEKR